MPRLQQQNIKVNEATAVPVAPVTPAELNVNLCDGDFRVTDEFLINYMDLGSHVMILDLDAPVSLSWGSKARTIPWRI